MAKPLLLGVVLMPPPLYIVVGTTSRLRHPIHDHIILVSMKKKVNDNMLRISKTVVIRGIASMPQSKLSRNGYTSSLKLNTGRYENVKKRVHIDGFLAVGLSADENEVCGVGSDRRK